MPTLTQQARYVCDIRRFLRS